MAAKTLIQRVAEPFSPEDQTLLDNYIIQQMAAGTTDGIRTTVVRTGVAGELIERNWTTVEAATAYLDFCGSFGPALSYAVTVS